MDKNKKKLAVITGAARGIGRTVAIMLSKTNYNLALIDLDEKALKETQHLCQTADNHTKIYTVDVASESEVVTCFKSILHIQQPIDFLFNNAAVLHDGLLVKKKGEAIISMQLTQWQQVIDVNLTGVFLCSRECAASMIQNNTGGIIINMSSIARHGNFGQTNYAASKAGVAAMTVTWAQELARYNIRCMAIAPGVIETDMTRMMKPESLKKIKAAIPVKSLGQTSHIAQTVQFILDNSYLTGRVIEIDGGLRF